MRIQGQGVDLSIKLKPTQTNTHQTNSCYGPGVGGLCGYSRCTSAIAAANCSQLIPYVTRGWFRVAGLDIPENVKPLARI